MSKLRSYEMFALAPGSDYSSSSSLDSPTVYSAAVCPPALSSGLFAILFVHLSVDIHPYQSHLLAHQGTPLSQPVLQRLRQEATGVGYWSQHSIPFHARGSEPRSPYSVACFQEKRKKPVFQGSAHRPQAICRWEDLVGCAIPHIQTQYFSEATRDSALQLSASHAALEDTGRHALPCPVAMLR